jgi:hypothetical protein
VKLYWIRVGAIEKWQDRSYIFLQPLRDQNNTLGVRFRNFLNNTVFDLRCRLKPVLQHFNEKTPDETVGRLVVLFDFTSVRNAG